MFSLFSELHGALPAASLHCPMGGCAGLVLSRGLWEALWQLPLHRPLGEEGEWGNIISASLKGPCVCISISTCAYVSLDYYYRGFTGGQNTEEVKQDKDDIINIFSVASGHLYERFLRLVALIISIYMNEFVTVFLFRE